MKHTYSHLDLNERRRIARWRHAGLSIDIICGEAWTPSIDDFPRGTA